MDGVSKKTRVQANAAVLPEVYDQVEAIAIKEDRSRSKVLEKLIQRGLAAYRKDGKLDDDGEKWEVVDIKDITQSDAKPVKP